MRLAEMKLFLKRYVSDTHGGQLLRNIYLNKAFARHMRDMVEARVLDAGCGMGMYTTTFGYHYPRFRFLGVDKDSEKIEIAKRRLSRFPTGNVAFEVMDLTRLEGAADFDAVYCVDVLEHIEDYPRVLREFMDSLRAGGRLFIHVPDAVQKRHLRRFEEHTQHDHVRTGFDKPSLESELRRLGFRVEESRHTFGYWGSLGWEISMLAVKKRWLAYLLLPWVYAFALLDSLRENPSGNGILIVCRKAG